MEVRLRVTGPHDKKPTELVFKALPALALDEERILHELSSEKRKMTWKTSAQDVNQSIETLFALKGGYGRTTVEVSMKDDATISSTYSVRYHEDDDDFCCDDDECECPQMPDTLEEFMNRRIFPLINALERESQRLRLLKLIEGLEDSVTREPLCIDDVRELRCGHLFAASTIRKLHEPKTCPMCRASIEATLPGA